MNRLCASRGRGSRRAGTTAAASIAGVLIALAPPTGCAGKAGSSGPREGAASRQAPRQPQTRVPVLVNGAPVGWDEIRPALAEAGGANAVAEIALERLLEEEIERRGLSLAPDATDRELAILLAELGSPDADGHALLGEVRTQRGLGEARFARMLRRSAMLRALAAGSVVVEPREVDLAERIRYGERRRAYVIVTPTEREASGLRAEILAAPVVLDAFMARAAAHSIDASAARGGRLDAVSPVDPAYPETIRRAIAATPTGGVSPILAIEDGFALAMVAETLPAEAPPPGVRDRIERELRRRKERLEMDRIATRLMDRAKITVLDRSLSWSWDASRASP